MPSDFPTFITQSVKPLNSRLSPLPISAASRVRAKSNGYTTLNDAAPAAPPAARLPAKNCQNSFSLSNLKILIYFSVKPQRAQ